VEQGFADELDVGARDPDSVAVALPVVRVRGCWHRMILAGILRARGKSRAALRADLFRRLSVARSSKYSRMTVVSRLDLAKNLSLSHAADFHHRLLPRPSLKVT